MIRTKYKLRGRVWLWPGIGTWHLVTLPKKESDEIEDQFSSVHRGWRSLPVTATVGRSTWQTSIFLDGKLHAYILPLKAAVRKKESIAAGKTVAFILDIHP